MADRVIYIPSEMFPGRVMNANHRPTPHERHRETRSWRDLGVVVARAAHMRPMPPPVLVVAEFRYKTNHVHDTANNYPTIKALLDGFVEAGMLAGDDDRRLAGPWLVRMEPNGPPLIRLTLRPLRQVADAALLVRGKHDPRHSSALGRGDHLPAVGPLDAPGVVAR